MAETVKHTPGPWEFDGDNAVMAEVGAHICTVSMGDDFPCLEDDQRANAEAECKANANLIAAAPELLEALKALLDQLVGDEFADDISSVVSARSAVSKAEGRS